MPDYSHCAGGCCHCCLYKMLFIKTALNGLVLAKPADLHCVRVGCCAV